MKHTTSAGKRSLIGALALSLMLGVGICRPAATASAEEGLLAEHKEEIVDAILQAREDLRNTVEDIRAIRDEVRAREQAEEESKQPQNQEGEPAPAQEGTVPAPADGTVSETEVSQTVIIQDETDGSERESLISSIRSRVGDLTVERVTEPAETGSTSPETPAEDPDGTKINTRTNGNSLISIDISDVTATLRDNPIHHDVPVLSNNNRFSNNTIIHQRIYDVTRYPVQPAPYIYSTAPKTGDANNIGLWVAVIGVSAAALAATLIILKKRKG